MTDKLEDVGAAAEEADQRGDQVSDAAMTSSSPTPRDPVQVKTEVFDDDDEYGGSRPDAAAAASQQQQQPGSRDGGVSTPDNCSVARPPDHDQNGHGVVQNDFLSDVAREVAAAAAAVLTGGGASSELTEPGGDDMMADRRRTSAGDVERADLGQCRVCGDEATGMYFGALVCVPCKVKFRNFETSLI